MLTQQRQLELQRKELETLREEEQEEAAVAPFSPRSVSPMRAQIRGYLDRRFFGAFDARFHSIHKCACGSLETTGNDVGCVFVRSGATPKDLRVLPDRIILVRHAESAGNVNKHVYSMIPDRKLPLTETGKAQAESAGVVLREELERDGAPFNLVFYISPYRRSYETYQGISKALPSKSIVGVFEDVQLREQDFGNFQDPSDKRKEMKERLEFGRFFYRFPNGESGADVYDRITIFEDHLVRDINAGRFAQGNTNLVLVTHGLALRIILMRWFHWTVDQFLNVYNPGNCKPIILERIVPQSTGVASWMHTKMLYRVAPDSAEYLRGATPEMLTPQYTSPFT